MPIIATVCLAFVGMTAFAYIILLTHKFLELPHNKPIQILEIVTVLFAIVTIILLLYITFSSSFVTVV